MSEHKDSLSSISGSIYNSVNVRSIAENFQDNYNYALEQKRSKTSSSKKMYGAIVRKQRNQRSLTQKELCDLVDLPRELIQNIEYGKAALTNETRRKLSKHLNMPILAIFPPDIDSFSDILTERFDFEIHSVDFFIKTYNEELSSEIDKIHSLYNINIKNQDSNSRSLADRMLHNKITFRNPDISKRNAVFLQQMTYIGFFELWIPHLDIDYLNFREEISIHEELFHACLEGNAKKIKAALAKHLAVSIKDVEYVLREIA